MADRNVRRLTVEPTAGLVNRLRVIDSAIALSRELGSALRIVWTRTPDLPCRFDELFGPMRGVQMAERSRTGTSIVRHIGSVFKYDRILTEATVERLIAARHDFTELRGARYPYIITRSRFFPDAGHLAGLAPVRPLAARVNEASARFTAFTVGVQLPRITSAPAFIAEMAALVRDEARTGFFVATGDSAGEAALRAEFGDRIITAPKHPDRGSPEVIKSEVVDLRCMSRTRLVLASQWSSLSELAAEIGGIPLRFIDEGGG